MEIIVDQQILQSRVLVARFITPPGQSAHQVQHQAVEMLINHLFPDTHGKYSHSPSGAPYIPGHEDVNISITHTRGIAAIAINANSLVGVDVEQVSERVIRVLPRVAHQSEILALNLSETLPEAYTTAWTAKEAIFKAIPESGIDFANHIIIKFPTLLCYESSTNLISYTAQEYRTTEQRKFNIVSIPLCCSHNKGEISHILTVAVSQK